MTSVDIVRLDVATLDSSGISALIGAGETVVERKQTVPKEGLGPSVGAYANSGGGWILLGVDNEGKAVGWRPPGRSEVHDWLRGHLREAVDPLPMFGCTTVEHQGESVVAVRIYPGSPPYVLRSSGSIYIREPGGKNPIRSQAQLLDLVKQSEQSESQANARLAGGSLIQELVLSHANPVPSQEQTRLAEWMMVVTPLLLPVDWRSRALSGSTVRWVTARLVESLDGLTLPPRGVGQAQPLDDGFLIDGGSEISGIGVRVVVDAAGTVAARLVEKLARGVLHTGAMADQRIAPLLALTAGTVSQLDGSGRALIRLQLRVTATAKEWKPIITLTSADRSFELNAGDAENVEVREEMALPVSADALLETAERMMRAVARRAEIPYWEP